MAGRAYKKYMKKNATKNEFALLKLFLISFCGMLLFFTFLIKSFSPSVDVSIGGEYSQEQEENSVEIKKIIDDRLARIQDEDQGRTFTDMMKNAVDVSSPNDESFQESQVNVQNESKNSSQENNISVKVASEPVYKVFIGTYTSAEQAKVAKDIIVETGSALNPIVKCVGSNNYTLQVGIFKNKASAEALLYSIQQNHLPARIIEDY